MPHQDGETSYVVSRKERTTTLVKSEQSLAPPRDHVFEETSKNARALSRINKIVSIRHMNVMHVNI
jgi:hypothetical protein